MIRMPDAHGPFDIIGDIHGCRPELETLLARLGYEISLPDAEGWREVRHPEGRQVIFLGDLVDRGPDTPGVLRLVMGMVRAGQALCVPGNHDVKFLRKLQGRPVKVPPGLALSLAQMAPEPPEFVAAVRRFFEGLESHHVLDDGRLVVAHGGMPERYQGKSSSAARDIALYGVTTGATDELGLPVRLDWGAEYRGAAIVVYGHTPVAELVWVNRTINIDTGAVFGGALTALRYPTLELLSVPAFERYAIPTRAFLPDRSGTGDGNPKAPPEGESTNGHEE